MKKHTYILITALQNEEDYIEDTILSVINQTVRPQCWLLCLNNSTDKSYDIIKGYEKQYPFIIPLVVDTPVIRCFTNKSRAIMHGYNRVRADEFDFVGILDADITFKPDYYERVMAGMSGNPAIGIANGENIELGPDGQMHLVKQHHDMAEGGAQFFRKTCFDVVNGYRALRYGGEDTLAGIMARRNKWLTVTFKDISYYHHRTMGTQDISKLSTVLFFNGIRDQFLGMSLFYAFIKLLNRLRRKPFIIGGLSWFVGYCAGYFLKKDAELDRESRKYFRREQLKRLSLLSFLNYFKKAS